MDWHAQEVDATLAGLGTHRDGLSVTDAARRFVEHGPNRLPEPPRRSALRRLGEQFTNVLILILVVAAVVTLLLDHALDAAVIAGVVLINALVGFIQEGKAERAMDAIRGMLSPRARVERDGHVIEIDATGIVPGDIVHLRSGDGVPADLRLVSEHNLLVDEAALTGESLPVSKSTVPVAPESALGDRRNMAYAGTLVRRGRATGVVVATAAATEIGRISAMLRKVQPLTTPLLLQIAKFGRVLSAVIVGSAVALFAFGTLFHGFTVDAMFLAAVAFAVAAIPEGLPAIITITLAIGVQAMARRNAIVRRLPAVEALGAVTVICSDKTGTLTRNEMQVTAVEAAPGRHDELLRCAVLCNDGADPTELALRRHAAEQGLDIEALEEAHPRIATHPFESANRYMVTAHAAFVLMKGAPEVIVAHCNGLDAAAWEARVRRLADAGQRTIAFATRTGELEPDDPGSGWTLLGVIGLSDPPRPEAIEAVAACQSAGIRVKMITGDHALTARAIGALLNIGDGERVLTGNDIDQMDDEELVERTRAVDIFARVSPAHKLRLVELMQADGEVVAMTGDGVNDAPALKRASVGVAMGRKGTDAAREAAEIVLADDNFASISAAVAEGRRIYDNIRKTILFILPTNAGEALTVSVAVLLGRSLPMTPVQVLWVNMVTAVTLALALVFERAEQDTMQRPPRAPEEPILTPMLVQRTLLVGVLMLAATFGVFLLERAAGASLEYARTAAVNTLVLCEVFYLLNTRMLVGGVGVGNAFAGNPWIAAAIATVLGLQLAFTHWGPMQTLFGTTDLSGSSWLVGTACGFAVYLIVEAEKALRRRVQR